MAAERARRAGAATSPDPPIASERLALNLALTMPPQATFWGKTWGMLTDNFHTPWIINGERVPF
jgi:hypothetical protein